MKPNQKKWLKWLTNRYFIVGLIFVVWMIFFDSSSLLMHHELNKEIKELKAAKAFYTEKISEDSLLDAQLQTPAGTEKYAREKYFMSKENEEVFIIEFEKNADQQ